MPQSGKHPHHHDISHMLSLTHPISSKRDIDIIAEPCAQRNVPSSPEFRDTFRHIGIKKVLFKFKTEHLPKTDRHIRISAEIKVDLERICRTSKPCA